MVWGPVSLPESDGCFLFQPQFTAVYRLNLSIKVDTMLSTPYTSPTREKEGNKWMKGGPWAEREEFRLQREGLLTAWLDEELVLTRELACALLGWQRTTPNLKMAERLLRRLAERGEFQWREQDNVTYAVTHAISLRTPKVRRQLTHYHMTARRSSTFRRAVNCTQRVSGAELRAMGGKVIFDELFKFDTYGLFAEDETGRHSFAKIPQKCRDIYRYHVLLKQQYHLAFFGVVWNCRLASWVPKIAAEIRKLPQEAWGFFLINHEGRIDPFRPDSVLDRIYLSPKDGEYHGLDVLFPEEK